MEVKKYYMGYYAVAISLVLTLAFGLKVYDSIRAAVGIEMLFLIGFAFCSLATLILIFERSKPIIQIGGNDVLARKIFMKPQTFSLEKTKILYSTDFIEMKEGKKWFLFPKNINTLNCWEDVRAELQRRTLN